MNGWLIVAVALVIVVALFRTWFRWFSRRPLSPLDEYAVGVDTAVDAADPVPAPPPSAPASPVDGTSGRSAFPRQRSLADAADAGGPATSVEPDERSIPRNPRPIDADRA